MRRSQRKNDSGFTLVEVLVVLVIVGLMAGLVGPQLFGVVDRSKARTATAQVQMLRGALQAYALDVGRLPTEEEDLQSLIQPPPDASGWNGPYLDAQVPNDPWGRPYVYRPKPDSLAGMELYSLGSDGQPGGEGSAADVGLLPQD